MYIYKDSLFAFCLKKDDEVYELARLDRRGRSRRVQLSSLRLSRNFGATVHGVDDAHKLLLPRTFLKQDFPISQREQGEILPGSNARAGVELVS